jgi:hypothetical protein
MGVFGLMVTLGLSPTRSRDQEVSRDDQRGQGHRGIGGLAMGQFQNRPREVLQHVNQPLAAAIIYPAAMAAWTYLAAFAAPRWAGRPLQACWYSSQASRSPSRTTAGWAKTPGPR